MKEKKLTYLEWQLLPYSDTREVREIKKYAKKISQIDDFKDLNLYLVQYYDTEAFNNKLVLSNFHKLLRRKTISIISSFSQYFGSYNPETKGIMIYIDNQIKYGKAYKVYNNLNNKIEIKEDLNSLKTTCSNILRTMYHEKRHHLQKTKKNNSFTSIVCQIEDNMKESLYGISKYFKNHDEWYFEIDANLYGVKKAIEYYENNPQDNHADMNYLKDLYYINKTQKYAYDFDKFFTMYNIYREKNPFYTSSKNIITSNIFLKDKEEIWHKVLYGDKKRLKPVEEIINNPLINKIDPKFINYVLTSKYLNKNTNYDELDYDTLIILANEFKKRIEDTEKTIDKDSTLYISLELKDYKRIKDDLIYYEDTLKQLQARINEYKNKKRR